MNVTLEVTPREIQTIEAALAKYGQSQSDFMRVEIAALLTKIRSAKPEGMM